MLTRFIKVQLVLFTILTASVLVVLGWYYLQLPTVVGIGQYKLYAELPRSGGLYATANVTYRGIQIGKVTAVDPTERGARATLSIDDHYKIPIDASANVHSVSAIGEQYLDLVSTGNPGQHFTNGQTITKSTVPAEIGPALDAANRGLAVLPSEKIASVLDETSQAVGGLGPALQRLVDSTQVIVHDFRDNLSPVNDIIAHCAPILDSQVTSGDPIERWAANLNTIGAQPPSRTKRCEAASSRPLLPPTRSPRYSAMCAMRYRRRWPTSRSSSICSSATTKRRAAAGGFTARCLAGNRDDALPRPAFAGRPVSVKQPPPCLTGFLPASQWRSPADTARHRCRRAPTARSRRTTRATWFAARATIRARMYPESGRPRRASAAATSRTCRWAPTRGTATPTRC